MEEIELTDEEELELLEDFVVDMRLKHDLPLVEESATAASELAAMINKLRQR